MRKIILFSVMLVFFLEKMPSQTVTDIDGNIYNTVTIGNQVWMKENLKVTHYRNGDSISEERDSIDWVNLKEGAWCYNENNPNNDSVYGKLYNWHAVGDFRGLAPLGWHVPSDSEWKTLEIYLGMSQATADLDQYRGTKEANALKEPGTTTHWTLDCCPGHEPNAGTNSSGFTALGGGFRWYFNAGDPYRSFSPPTGNAQFWTYTAPDDSTAWLRHLCVYHEDILRVHWSKTNGSSIRCLRDAPVQINEINDDMEMEIFPNPAQDEFTISGINTEDIGSITLSDMLGNEVMKINKSEFNFSESYNTITIGKENLSKLCNEMYILRFNSNRKIIKAAIIQILK